MAVTHVIVGMQSTPNHSTIYKSGYWKRVWIAKLVYIHKWFHLQKSQRDTNKLDNNTGYIMVHHRSGELKQSYEAKGYPTDKVNDAMQEYMINIILEKGSESYMVRGMLAIF